MAAGTTIQLKRKAGAFTGGQLAAGEIGIDTTNGVIYFSTNGSTVTAVAVTASNVGAVYDEAIRTLTNKRITARITSITSSATPTINTDNCDAVTITALATAITSMTTNLSGAPSNFDMLMFRIKDNGTARAITWGTSFEAKGAALPTTTVLGKVLHVLFIWDSVTSKWGCLSTAQEA